VLGDLEARVMQAVWEIGRPAPARAVHERVAREHSVAIHTVITVLNKLVEKGSCAAPSATSSSTTTPASPKPSSAPGRRAS
jgi:predicted transcriptional regulator